MCFQLNETLTDNLSLKQKVKLKYVDILVIKQTTKYCIMFDVSLIKA